MESAKLNLAAKISEKLPLENGIITQFEGEHGIGYAVEFQNQTIKLEFVFDTDDATMRSYAELVANGAMLLDSFIAQVLQDTGDKAGLLKSFNFTFNVLLNELKEARKDLSAHIREEIGTVEEEPPTVGEKGE